VLDPYGNTEPLSGASGGTMGGLNTFISQVLEPAQKGLDFLAQSFVNEVNVIQRSGIDGYGHLGVDLLRIDDKAASAAFCDCYDPACCLIFGNNARGQFCDLGG